jgi:hypothetical protein
MRCKQLEMSDAVRDDDTWIIGFDARSSGPLIDDPQAASEITQDVTDDIVTNRSKVISLQHLQSKSESRH